MSAKSDAAMAHRIPGLVDLQINGGFGYDFTAEPDSIWEVAARLPEHGVTAFLPTVISSPAEIPLAALRVLGQGPPVGWVGARPLGLHLEGPFLSPERRGTHVEAHLAAPDLNRVERWIDAGPPAMVTLAPELPGATQVITALRAAGTVVAVGHSACRAAEAEVAFESGAAHVTHLFNAMSGMDHRNPGLAAAALSHPRATVGLIADGVHVHPTMLRLAFRALGASRIALVTDAVAALGMEDGDFRLGGTTVNRVQGVVRDAAGALAGAATSLPETLRTMRAATGAAASDVLAMASTTPARIVGFTPPVGDVVLLDDDFGVVSTTIDDRLVYQRES